MEDKLPWVIHYVEENCDACKDKDECTSKLLMDSFEGIVPFRLFGFADVHTHGLLKTFNHPELVLSVSIGIKRAKMLLNSLGLRIMNEGARFDKPSVRSDILGGGYDAELIRFPGDDEHIYIMLPDENNSLPSDDDCLIPYSRQDMYSWMLSKIHEYD